MKKIISLAFFAFLCILTIQAQTEKFNLNGSVLNSETNEALIGATIFVKETNTATTTDRNGNYSVNITKLDSYTVEYSYVGYETKVIVVDATDGKISASIVSYLKPSIVQLDEFNINASRVDDNSPITYSNLDKKTINKIVSGKDLPMLLQSTPSLISMSDNGAGIGATNFTIRGTDMNRINITINGIPLNDAESQNVFFSNMPDFISSVDNVQIQRGVGTSTDGTAAFGATVNFKTKEIESDPYGLISLGGGSFNTFKTNVQVGSGLMDNNFTFNVGASILNTDGYVDRAFADMKSFYFDGAYIGKKFYAKIMNYTGKQRTYQAWNGVDPEMMLESRTYNPAGEIYGYNADGEYVLLGYYDNETDNYLQSTTHLTTAYKINDYLKANLAFHYTYGKGFYENYKNDQKLSKYQENPGEILIQLGENKRTNLIRQKWLDNDFYGLVYSLSFDKDRFNMILGGGYNKYLGDHFGKIPWAKDALVVDKDKNYYFSDAVKNDFNIYYKINFAITKQLNIFGDVQYRNIEYKIRGIRDDLQNLDQDHNFNFINPKAGLVWNNNNHRAYASFGIANREPNRDNFCDAYPDATPRPERLYDYELGYKYNFKRAFAGISLYYMDYKDQLVLTGEINHVGDPIMVNVDKSYRMGIELEGAAEIIPGWLWWNANLTLSRNKILDYVQYVDNWNYWDDPDNSELQIKKEFKSTDISFSPSIIGFNNITGRIYKGLSASLISKYVGKQYIDNCSDENQKLNAYFVTDFKLDYTLNNIKFAKDINLFVSVNNIFNTKYETRAWLYRYYSDGEEGFSSGYFPQAGINIFGGITVKF